MDNENLLTEEQWFELAEELSDNLEAGEMPVSVSEAKTIMSEAFVLTENENADTIEISTPEAWLWFIDKKWKPFVGKRN